MPFPSRSRIGSISSWKPADTTAERGPRRGPGKPRRTRTCSRSQPTTTLSGARIVAISAAITSSSVSRLPQLVLERVEHGEVPNRSIAMCKKSTSVAVPSQSRTNACFAGRGFGPSRNPAARSPPAGAGILKAPLSGTLLPSLLQSYDRPASAGGQRPAAVEGDLVARGSSRRRGAQEGDDSLTSSGTTSRPAGFSAPEASISSRFGKCSSAPVSTTPAETALTRMPRGASSTRVFGRGTSSCRSEADERVVRALARFPRLERATTQAL